jgi:hypothetical protein
MKVSLGEDLYSFVNAAINTAINEEKYIFDVYSFLKTKQYKRSEVLIFLSSSLVTSIAEEIYQLETYLNSNSSLHELYGWMGKSKAKRLKEYLNSIIDDLKKYEREKRPGRKPRSNKQQKASNK